jgi:hypothetical protein
MMRRRITGQQMHKMETKMCAQRRLFTPQNFDIVREVILPSRNKHCAMSITPS